MKKILLFAFLVWAIAKVCFATVTVTSGEGWSNVFFGEETELTFSITADASFQGMAGWRFSIGGRTLSRGENRVDVGPGRSQTVTVRMPVPEGKEGVSLPGTVTISVYDNGKDVAATYEKEIQVFSKNPFIERQHWLATLNLALFDPKMTTAGIFTKSKINYKEIFHKDALPEIKKGIVIIGEGVSLIEYRGLSRMISELAASGIPVICLAPSEGVIPVPEAFSGVYAKRPCGMQFMQNKIIKHFDKTLDARSWPPDGQVAESYMRITEGKKGVVALINKRKEGWPWMEVQYSNQNGRLIVCGFAIMDKWHYGPAPRYLFLRLLEHIVGNQSGRTGSG